MYGNKRSRVEINLKWRGWFRMQNIQIQVMYEYVNMLASKVSASTQSIEMQAFARFDRVHPLNKVWPQCKIASLRDLSARLGCWVSPQKRVLALTEWPTTLTREE